jgi:hypothetical protein
MSRHVIQLNHVVIDEASCSVEVAVEWNGALFSKVYSSFPNLAADNADIITNSDEAIRHLLFYLLALLPSADALPTLTGKTLTMDVGPTVQQLISVV